MKALDFVEALKISDDVFNRYKDQRPEWYARINHTPILSDIAVRMAEAFTLRDITNRQFPPEPLRTNLGEVEVVFVLDPAMPANTLELRSSSSVIRISGLKTDGD